MLDLTHVRSFLMVSDVGSFSLAARRLGLNQSTISQHVRRLEDRLGRRLLVRDTHHVALTADGEALLPDARLMLALASKVDQHFSAANLRGHLRLGVSEDLVGRQLPLILDAFACAHPSVDLALTVALSAPLFAMQDAGEIDLVFAKRRVGETRGRFVCREPLVWLARDPERLGQARPLPLIAFSPPSITRAIALETLERAGIPWRLSCTCESLSGLTAAARAGMGVFVQPRRLAPSGLREVSPDLLPPLDDVEFILVARKGADQALVRALSDEVMRTMAGMPVV
ncbi:LysR family transcriptional regulator [Insolitispirillum peregrinum]|uniref:DNA-binding transcriptional regulator, LysR family n=1 Tax=Insolitispirillum peregrinum TaxID=80876 RepID=A0A1N7MZ63_9PROT|nr:LysR substrate-binding domain-containing protein [Insolitispirillum peregrinum]SIS91406.1 DNA-binding transcriptional regulator, LysR family [Insolitispirillum peregrinum]